MKKVELKLLALDERPMIEFNTQYMKGKGIIPSEVLGTYREIATFRVLSGDSVTAYTLGVLLTDIISNIMEFRIEINNVLKFLIEVEGGEDFSIKAPDFTKKSISEAIRLLKNLPYDMDGSNVGGDYVLLIQRAKIIAFNLVILSRVGIVEVDDDVEGIVERFFEKVSEKRIETFYS